MPFPDFSSLKFHEILPCLENSLASSLPEEILSFYATDPDLCSGKYAGETISTGGEIKICRSWHAWCSLAHELGCRMLTPHRQENGRILVRFQKLQKKSFHLTGGEPGQKYALRSPFARISKEEEPAFAYPFIQALHRLEMEKRRSILDLGINRADELEAIRDLVGKHWEEMEITGIDLAYDALEEAQRRWPALTTYAHDLNHLEELKLGRFDLILSIGTLQSPSIEMKPLIMRLVQEHLHPDGALLLGWPNSRWIDGELLYGARVKNYPFSELSLVIKDLFWIKKYLQQHRFRVVITGKEYLFLEARRMANA